MKKKFVSAVLLVTCGSTLYSMDPKPPGRLYPLLNVAGKQLRSGEHTPLLPQPPYHVAPGSVIGSTYPHEPPPAYQPTSLTGEEHTAIIANLQTQLQNKQANLAKLSPEKQALTLQRHKEWRLVRLGQWGTLASFYFLIRQTFSIVQLAGGPTMGIENIENIVPFVSDFLTWPTFVALTIYAFKKDLTK